MRRRVFPYQACATSTSTSSGVQSTQQCILLFFVYGIVFCLAATDSITSTTENRWYTFLNVGSKLAMSIAFVAIRGNEYHESLSNALTKINISNLGMVSILRGSFDLVLPCRATLTGGCSLPLEATPDLRKLETVLGCTLAGVPLVDLVAGQCAKDAFRSYVKHTLRQARSETTQEGARLMSNCVLNRAGKEVVPPVAQVFQCHLLRASSGRSADAVDMETVAACIHTCVVPDSVMSFSSDLALIVAIRLLIAEREHDGSESVFGRNVSQSATFNAIESTAHGADDSSHSAQPFQRFVRKLADLTLMGIDFVANSRSHTESDKSSCPEPSTTTPQMVQSEETTCSEIERAVTLLTSRRRSHVPQKSGVKQPAVDDNIDILHASYEDAGGAGLVRSSQNNDMPSSEFGLRPMHRFLTDVDRKALRRDESTWARKILVGSTTATAVVAAIVAIRLRSRNV
eukprot:TRINITY_DN7928_c0_g7_i2.p1 TRINITY_DN7928_c0_g7~~TRINITY_DN7928_c0_g7_i2.p1  ORF type:complete len:458 (+),score=26.12 TRINITY_DN7928_c0_g7_i2:325-1698(+)